MKTKLLIVLVLALGALTACGAAPATTAPASAPTEAPAQSTQATEAPVASTTDAPATEAPAAGGSVSFANDVLPLLTSRCGSCHGESRRQEDLSVTSYANLMAGSKNGLVVIAGNANDSLLVELVATQKMPKRGPKLTPDEIQLITDWVNQGAADN